MKALVSIIALVILSLTAVSCAQPVAPTATAYPTYTPAPTYTPYPTLTDLPTHTPYPTPEPLPTHTPYPTPTALPTYTPYPAPTSLPTHTPYPTYTPYPTVTVTPFPSPTPVPEETSYRTYTSFRDRFEVSIPDNWIVDNSDREQYSFEDPNEEVVVIVTVAEISILSMSEVVAIFISVASEKGIDVLEHRQVETNKWYLRTSFSIQLCDFDADVYLIRNGDILYNVTTSTCSLLAPKWKEVFDVFHSSFDYW